MSARPSELDPRPLLFETVTRLRGVETLPEDLLESVFAPSKRRTARERVQTYADMIRRRLDSVFEEDYPAVRRLLGAAAFLVHVRRFLAEHPPSARSLNLLSLPFAGWLADLLGGHHPVAEVARLEALLLEVQDEPDEKPLSPAELKRLQGAAALEAKLRPVASTRLASFRHDVVGYVQAVLAGLEAPPRGPVPGETHALVRRDGLQVRFSRLGPDEAALLADLSGRTLGEALERHVARTGDDPGRAALRVSEWFRDWAALRLLTLGPDGPAAA